MKKIIAVLVVLLLALSVFAACKETETYADYTVKIVDGLGNPMSDVIVEFTGPTGVTSSRVTGLDGVAVLKNSLVGDYSVVLQKGFSTAVITQSRYTLSAEVKTLNLILRDEEKSVDIYGAVEDNSYACKIGTGTYTIPSNEGKTNYYLFNALTKGVYEFTVESENAGTTVAYFGGPMFVQATHVGDGEYNGKTFQIIVQDSLTPYVIGVTVFGEASATLNVERVSDAPFDPEYLAWTDVNMKADISENLLPDGTTLVDFDITDSTLSVVERDGFYYTADGKPVYIRITKSNNKYLPDASLKFLAGYDDKNFGINIGGYVYDEDGNFVDKLSYNVMIKSYMEYCDSTYGVVPLTKELAEGIKLHGESTGWWNPQSGNYLFSEYNVVEENAWLFLCMIEK